MNSHSINIMKRKHFSYPFTMTLFWRKQNVLILRMIFYVIMLAVIFRDNYLYSKNNYTFNLEYFSNWGTYLIFTYFFVAVILGI